MPSAGSPALTADAPPPVGRDRGGRRRPAGAWLRSATLLLALAGCVAAGPTGDPVDLVRRAAVELCRTPGDAGAAFARLEGEARPVGTTGGPRLSRTRYRLGGGDELTVERPAGGPSGGRVVLALDRPDGRGGLRPEVLALVMPDCRIAQGRRLVYDAEGHPAELRSLGAGLAPTAVGESLDPEVPKGADPGGVTVALIDSGLAYTLPAVADRLARDPAGRPLGYDFWDLDDRPFDGDFGRSPFFPVRHGTSVASVLVREAPGVRLIPYRYPRPDMRRLADVVADAGRKGARLVGVALGGDDRADWDAFAAAALARTGMLFVVSAGNNGRNIDERPVYPASLTLPNLLVVTSADAEGRLARGANFGPRSVDLMAPGEDVDVIDHTGAPGKASGTSFAVPRVLAAAARLLAAHPDWDGTRVRRALIGLARPLPGPFKPPVRHGLLTD